MALEEGDRLALCKRAYVRACVHCVDDGEGKGCRREGPSVQLAQYLRLCTPRLRLGRYDWERGGAVCCVRTAGLSVTKGEVRTAQVGWRVGVLEFV